MSGDLLTLRMLFVAAPGAADELWREATALASLPIDLSVTDPANASAKLTSALFDVVIFDAGIGAAERGVIVNSTRASRPAPLVCALAPSGADTLEGVSVIFPVPANAAAIGAICERCIGMRLPKRVLVVDDSKTMRSIVRKI